MDWITIGFMLLTGILFIRAYRKLGEFERQLDQLRKLLIRKARRERGAWLPPAPDDDGG